MPAPVRDPRQPSSGARPAEPADRCAPLARLGPEGRFFTAGNRVDPMVDGDEILDGTLKLLRQAREHVSLHLYDLSHPDILEALKEDAARGVRVRVIVDPAGSSGKERRDAVIRKLRNAGVEVVRYKVDEGKRQIDHVKLLIVDGRQMVIGGMNGTERSTRNHDYAVRIEGQAVNYFNAMFERDWLGSKGKEPAVRHPEVKDTPGEALVSGGVTGGPHNSMAAHVYHALDGAKRSIFLEAFFLSDRGAVEKLIAARNRGVDVRVILDPSTVSWGDSPNVETFKTLRAAGVDVRWYLSAPGDRLHAKLGLIDEERTVMGSANWSYKGFQVNREAGVTVVDRQVTSRFVREFLDDWENYTTTDLDKAREGVDPVAPEAQFL